MLFAIEGKCSRVTLDGHLCANGLDGEVAVGHLKGYVGKVLVFVRETGGREVHVYRARIRAPRQSRTSGIEVTLGIERALLDGHIIASYLMFLTIVVVRSVMANDNDRCLNRLDGLVTVRNLKDHVSEIGVDVLELTRVKAHFSCTIVVGSFHNIGTLRLGRAAKREVTVNVI